MPAASSGAKAASRSAVAAPAGPEPTMTATRRSTNALLAPRDGPRHCPRPCPLTAPVAAGGTQQPHLPSLPRPGRPRPDAPGNAVFQTLRCRPGTGRATAHHGGSARTVSQEQPRTVRAVHEVQHPRHAGTRRPDARVAGSDSVGAGCHLRSVTNDRDHAVRGVQMAVEMQEPDADASPEVAAGRLRAPFEIRIGINTGQASIGNFGSKGRMDYTAIGRQVNLAARLQAYCRPGKILISHSTWVLVQEHVSCTPQGEIQVKGFQNPVKVYEVAGLLSPSAGTMSLPGTSGTIG